MHKKTTDKPYLLQFTQVGEPQTGFLVSTQLAQDLPFEVKRVFWVQHVPQNHRRGHHANRITEEVLVVLQGQVSIQLEDREGTHQFALNQPQTGLYIPALTWIELAFSENAIVVCLTSTDFDEADYIRDYHQFKALFAGK